MISYGWFFSTHQKINFASYMSAFRKLRTRDRFPNYNHILTFSGSLGPDRFWTRKQQKSSWHVFNPATGKGNAGWATQKYYDKLVSELTRKKRPKMIKAGRYAAWLSHFAVDALSPSHQIGKEKIKEPIRDWFDPHWKDEEHWAWNLRRNHLWFEIGIASMYIVTETPRSKYDSDFANSLKPKYMTEAIKEYVEKQARKVYRFNIYRKFKKEGFSPDVKELIYDRLMPLIVETVATIWRSALVESQKIIKAERYV